MGNNKSPGIDGLARNFYKYFWAYLKHEGALYKEVFPGKIEAHLSVTDKARVKFKMAGDLNSRKVSCK